MNGEIPLPELAARLRDATRTDVPNYRKLHVLARDGAFPTETRRGRIFVRAADLPAVAAALGLEIAPPRFD